MPRYSLSSADQAECLLKNQKLHRQVVVMGGAKVGKTAIIHHFLFDNFLLSYQATVEEMYHSEFDMEGQCLELDILDTSGVYEFPAMRRLAIAKADVIVLVFAVDDPYSFDEVRELREAIIEQRKGHVPPVVVVGNKTDLEHREIPKEMAETVATIDWECGYIESSACTGENIVNVFSETLNQSHVHYALGEAVKKRRRSLPANLGCSKKRHSISLKRHSCILS